MKMAQNGKEGSKEQPIQIISPKLYRLILNELENLHIHPYDMQVSGVKEENGVQLIFRFGDGYAHSASQFFSNEVIEDENPELKKFVQHVGEEGKKTMIADYFKMMKM